MSEENYMKANELNVGILYPVKSFDLDQNSDFHNLDTLRLIYQTAFEAQESSTAFPTPVIFENQLEIEKEASGSEGTVLYGVVRKGIKFSDGTELTAKHVADSLSNTSLVSEQADVECDGDKVRFRLKRLDPLFSLVLTNLITAIKTKAGRKMIGTGPYMPAPNQVMGKSEVRLIKNPHYAGETYIPEICFRVYPLDSDGQPTALFEAVENGDVDLTTCLSVESAQKIKSALKIVKPGTSTATLFFNVARSPMDNVDLRKAISLVIDRKYLSKLFYQSSLTLTANNLLPPMIGRMPPDMLFPNINQAKNLVAEKNINVSTPLKMVVVPGPRPYLPNPGKAAEYIKTQLQENLGIEVDICQSASFQDYYRYTSVNDYHMVLGGFIADTPNPADYLEAHLSSDYIASATHGALNNSNLSRMDNAEMDKAIQDLRIQPANEKRLRAVSDIIKRELPLMPLLYGPSVLVHSRELTGFTPNFDSTFALNNLKWKYSTSSLNQVLTGSSLKS
jgi:ABC-type transport system substrate-binding protein